jgi:hypothetical protein
MVNRRRIRGMVRRYACDGAGIRLERDAVAHPGCDLAALELYLAKREINAGIVKYET